MGKISFRSLGALALLLLASCGALPGAESAQDEPVLTATPAPGTRRWDAKPVLVSVYSGPGYVYPSDAWGVMPDLVVYASGLVILTTYAYRQEQQLRSVEEAHISPLELCALLARVEARGFFEFNPQEYATPQAFDSGTTYIDVEAWRRKSIAAYALQEALWEKIYGEVPPALADTYNDLISFRPSDRKPYQPERVAVLVGRRDDIAEAPAWPLKTSSLKTLASVPGQYFMKESLVEGQAAADVYALFEQEASQLYSEDGIAYSVTVSPLLPHEIWKEHTQWIRKPLFENAPTRELVCEAGEN
jgi:hypothetical protein